MADRFCRDCKHARGEDLKMTCDSPNNVVDHVATEKYLVTGIEQPVIQAMRGASCVALRQARDPATEALVCGPDGKWFEEKS